MIEIINPLRVATLNVRGLADRRRQSQVCRLVLEKELNIVAIQETKVEGEEQTQRMMQQLTAHHNVCICHAVGVSGGCMLLIKQSLGAVIQNVVACLEGRLIVCDFAIMSRDWRAVVIYAPTRAEERKVFFEGLRAWLDTERLILLLGDFNCVCSARDKSSETRFRDASTSVLQETVEEFCLEDVGDVMVGSQAVQFTHFQGRSHARLDRAYVSLEILSKCHDYRVTPVSFSDHCLVSFTIGGRKRKVNRFNWDLWKMNSKLLQDEEFRSAIAEKIKKLELESFSCSSKWETFKQETKLTALERSSALKYIERERERLLRSSLASLISEECQTPGACKEEIRTLKSQLEVIDKEKYYGALVRARAEKMLFDESPTKRALGLEKRHACKKQIAEIENDRGIWTEQADIEHAFRGFYETLFSVHPSDVNKFKEEFLNAMPRLGDDIRANLEAPITINEVKKAIDDLSPGKTPGPDGLGAAFYKIFKHELSPVLCDVYAEAYENNVLPPSFRQSHTVLIPKTEDVVKLRSMGAYRPISLSNVDYKILMKILAGRLQSVVQDIVGPHQTCGIKGRSIITNVHIARSILDCCDSTGQVVAMLQIDLEKAFDKVSHELLILILQQINVGQVITQGVQMAYSQGMTSLVINNEVSSPIPVKSSIGPGCPISSLFFVFTLKLFV